MDPKYAEFLKIESLADRPAIESLNILGSMVDSSSDDGHRESLKHAIRLANTIIVDADTEEHQALLDYYIANAWSGLKQLRGDSTGGSWEWSQPEIEKELFHLRKARRSSGFAKLPGIRKCQILTNEGNCLNHLGRFVEAIDSWDKALTIEPDFSMARGNLGIGLWTYARSLYDRNQQTILANAAWRELDSAQSLGTDVHAAPYFQKAREEIESIFQLDVLRQEYDLNDHQVGVTDGERDYRRWCLEHCLFLNPINDLGAFNAATHDILTCPSVVTSIDEGPNFHGFFNQIKQEFCSARWLAYEGITDRSQHFSDNHVLLYNTLDYPCYSLSTEKLKLAFRSLYSLFDKIAYFLNAYMKLNIPEKSVYFRTLWYEKNDKKCIREVFREHPNLALRGLFWLAKDLYEDRQEFREVMDPDARHLKVVRDYLEHKHLKVHLELWENRVSGSDSANGFPDSLAHSLSRSEFENMVYRLLSLSRAALIYLSLGTHREERIKAQTRPSDSVIVPIVLELLEDEWKY